MYPACPLPAPAPAPAPPPPVPTPGLLGGEFAAHSFRGGPNTFTVPVPEGAFSGSSSTSEPNLSDSGGFTVPVDMAGAGAGAGNTSAPRHLSGLPGSADLAREGGGDDGRFQPLDEALAGFSTINEGGWVTMTREQLLALGSVATDYAEQVTVSAAHQQNYLSLVSDGMGPPEQQQQQQQQQQPQSTSGAEEEVSAVVTPGNGAATSEVDTSTLDSPGSPPWHATDVAPPEAFGLPAHYSPPSSTPPAQDPEDSQQIIVDSELLKRMMRDMQDMQARMSEMQRNMLLILERQNEPGRSAPRVRYQKQRTVAIPKPGGAGKLRGRGQKPDETRGRKSNPLHSMF